MAGFAEVDYDKGWTAPIAGEGAPAFRADYVLRAMRLPAGTHVVEWRFRAPGWRAAEAVTGICSVVILASAAAAVVLAVRRKRRGNGRQEATNTAE